MIKVINYFDGKEIREISSVDEGMISLVIIKEHGVPAIKARYRNGRTRTIFSPFIEEDYFKAKEG